MNLPIVSPALPGAACAETSAPDAWFPGKWDNAAGAKRICKTKCPEVASCLKWALDNNEQYGIWGGHGPEELRKMRRDRDKEGAA